MKNYRKLRNVSITSLSYFSDLFPIEVVFSFFHSFRLTNYFNHKYFLSDSPVSKKYLVIIVRVMTIHLTNQVTITTVSQSNYLQVIRLESHC